MSGARRVILWRGLKRRERQEERKEEKKAIDLECSKQMNNDTTGITTVLYKRW